MKRTTIFAEDYLLDEVKSLAKKQKTSVATVVREALVHYLAVNKEEQPAELSFIAIGASGESDIAGRHEELLWQK
ncbi:MAG: CopG family transcriptional regulator [Desulfuromonadaceae bacterium]